jgi:hypothetical protein
MNLERVGFGGGARLWVDGSKTTGQWGCGAMGRWGVGWVVVVRGVVQGIRFYIPLVVRRAMARFELCMWGAGAGRVGGVAWVQWRVYLCVQRSSVRSVRSGVGTVLLPFSRTRDNSEYLSFIGSSRLPEVRRCSTQGMDQRSRGRGARLPALVISETECDRMDRPMSYFLLYCSVH